MFKQKKPLKIIKIIIYNKYIFNYSNWQHINYIQITKDLININLPKTTRSDCNKHIIKREHYARKNGEWKPKKKFDSQEEADQYIKEHKLYRYSSYICKVCNKWHIGMKNIIKIEYNEENQ